MAIYRGGGSSEKVTIDGEKVREKLNLESFFPLITLKENVFPNFGVGSSNTYVKIKNDYYILGEFGLYKGNLKDGWSKIADSPIVYIRYGFIFEHKNNLFAIIMQSASDATVYSYSFDFQTNAWQKHGDIIYRTDYSIRARFSLNGYIYCLVGSEFYRSINDGLSWESFTNSIKINYPENNNSVFYAFEQGFINFIKNGFYYTLGSISRSSYDKYLIKFDGVNVTAVTTSEGKVDSIYTKYPRNMVFTLEENILFYMPGSYDENNIYGKYGYQVSKIETDGITTPPLFRFRTNIIFQKILFKDVKDDSFVNYRESSNSEPDAAYIEKGYRKI